MRREDGIEAHVPCHLSCVVVRRGKVVTCDAKLITEWLCAGYTIIGVADTEDGIRQLQEIAKEVC